MTKRIDTEEDQPFFHPDHPRPRTRREFLGQGFIAGSAYVVAPSILSMLGVNKANAQASCALTGAGAGKVPFIGIDLGGGANIAGSNVMVGGPSDRMPCSPRRAINVLVCRSTCRPSIRRSRPSIGR